MNEEPLTTPCPCAAIDVGSNTIRLLICAQRDGRLIRVKSLRAVTRLGESLHKTGEIRENNIGLSIDALRIYKRECETFGVRNVYAVGTSALREATNADTVLKAFFDYAGINVEVISGDREAHLTLLGILQGIPDHDAARSHLLIDIGGGSTEWVLPRTDPLQSGSMPIGALKLYEKHIAHDPPSSGEISAAKNEITEWIQRTVAAFSRPPEGLMLTGGTASTLAAIDLGIREYDGKMIHLHTLNYPDLLAMHERFLSLPRELRKGIRGLEPDRADIIITGNLIAMALMETSGLSRAVVSDYGLLEGMIAEYAAGFPA